jgi:hypothetical protein
MMLSMPVNFILIKADTGAGEALKNVNPGAVEAVENDALNAGKFYFN